MPASVDDPLCPPLSGENARGRENIDQCPRAVLVAFYEITDATPQTPRAPAPTGLRADDPAAQLAPLLAGQASGERTVRGLQEVMSLVEDIARRHRCIVEFAESGLR